MPIPRSHRWPAASASLVALMLSCRPGPDPTTVPGTGPATTPEPPVAPASCGAPGGRFEEHAWAPPDAPAVLSVALDDPGLTDALAHLVAHTRGSGHGLPISLAFSLGQWSWQIPVVVATLRQAGFEPAELVFVADAQARHAWVWRSACDLDQAVAQIEAAWGLRSRRTVEGVVATALPTEPAAPGFPYDVLMLPGERFALVPRGSASALLGLWSRPAPATSLSGAPPATAGRRLDDVAAAAIRGVFSGRALLDPSATSAPDEPRTLRVIADGVAAALPATSDASVPDR